MAQKTALARETVAAECLDRPPENQNSQAERPASEQIVSWQRRRDRLLERLNHVLLDGTLAAQSAWAVVQGLQRARALADEGGTPRSIVCQSVGGEELLIAGRAEHEGTADHSSTAGEIPAIEAARKVEGKE
jgi:hypothetical protein